MQQYKLGLVQLGKLLFRPGYMLLAVLIYLPTLWIFTYIAQLGAFIHILGLGGIPIGERLSIVAESVFNVFEHATDPLALSLIVFAAIATLNLVLLAAHRQQRSAATTSAASAGGVSIAIVGAHCVACGGSLLAPFVTAMAGSGIFIGMAGTDMALLITLGVNALALLLILHATLKLAAKTTVPQVA